jgi:hypothetical protein
VIVGTYQATSLASHGFILNGKKLAKPDYPNGTTTYDFSINPDGANAKRRTQAFQTDLKITIHHSPRFQNGNQISRPAVFLLISSLTCDNI